MSLLVIKFGGTSVGDVERIKNAAGKVAAEVRLGHKVVVVVSAMAGVTDQLIQCCRSITPRPDAREQDAIVASGEQVSAGLMALALEQRGFNARSWQGWQLPLNTDSTHSKARITSVNTETLRRRLDEGEIAVITGFQGIASDGSITTLGRGGSDTSAVAIAAALKADRCDIYTDVEGVYTSDPRIVPKAQKLSRVSYEEMLELSSLGAKVLQVRSVEMALRFHVPVQVLSTFGNAIGSELPGTLVTDEDETMERKVVTGVAMSPNQAKVTLSKVLDRPGVAATIFGALGRAGVNVDMIVQTSSDDEQTTDVTFTVNRSDLERARQVIEAEREKIGYASVLTDSNVVKISLVGAGMRSHSGVAALMFETLADKKINIQTIETSEISISVLIAEEYAELALRSLHTTFGLDAV